MSAYDPYRFLPPQARPSASNPVHSKVFVPRYGSPDLDLNVPMSDHSESVEDGGHSVEYEGGDQSNGHESGPSRKRTRVDDESRAVQSSSRASMGGQPPHDQPRQRQRPIPVSMFGLDARNDLTREIGNWIVNTCQGLQDIEVSLRSHKTSVNVSLMRID